MKQLSCRSGNDRIDFIKSDLLRHRCVDRCSIESLLSDPGVEEDQPDLIMQLIVKARFLKYWKMSAQHRTDMYAAAIRRNRCHPK